jgi:hypothetical protein
MSLNQHAGYSGFFRQVAGLFFSKVRRFPRSEILQQSGRRLGSFCPENRMTCDGKVERFIVPSG